MRGLKAAQDWHETHKGLPYAVFKIKSDDKIKQRVVRVLLPADEIVSLPMHNKYQVIKPTRCASSDESPDPEICPLCEVKAPRSFKTYIPVYVFPSNDAKQQWEGGVQIIEYGRNNLQEVISVVEELPGEDIQAVAFKIKRLGEKTDTKYKWIALVDGPALPAEELEVPNIDELITIKDEDELRKIAIDFQRSTGAKSVESDASEEDEDEEEIPF